jgi:hypothetical protein
VVIVADNRITMMAKATFCIAVNVNSFFARNFGNRWPHTHKYSSVDQAFDAKINANAERILLDLFCVQS